MFEHDLFISYAHVDNKHLYDSDRGWVDLLHNRLGIRLEQLLGEEPKIWRDPKLNGNDYFSETLLIKLSQVAMIVSIVSPSYINSEWCLKELREFHKQAAANEGIHIDNKSRIFKVIKTPVSDTHIQELQGLRGYAFFEELQTTSHFREFDHAEGSNRDKKYWDSLEDLAQDIKEMVERLGNRRQIIIKPSGKTIYLAETTSDLSEKHDRIRRELQQNGHRVLPDRPLSHDRHIRHEVSRCLAESQISVHLIGTIYGVVPEEESTSIIEIQREMASKYSKSLNFSQIIWMPQDLSPKDKRQQKFISQLLNHLNLPILQNKLEDLKTLIHEKLNPPASPKISDKGVNAPPVIYVICDKTDYEAVKPIEEYLFQHGFNLVSLASGASLKKHKYYLQECDAALVYCRNATDTWLEAKRNDFLQLPGYQREKPLLAKAFYFSGPQTRGKDRFKLRDCIVIPDLGQFPPNSLDTFVKKIKEAKGTGND